MRTVICYDGSYKFFNRKRDSNYEQFECCMPRHGRRIGT